MFDIHVHTWGSVSERKHKTNGFDIDGTVSEPDYFPSSIDYGVFLKQVTANA